MIKLVIFDRDDTLNIDIGFTFKKEDCNWTIVERLLKEKHRL